MCAWRGSPFNRQSNAVLVGYVLILINEKILLTAIGVLHTVVFKVVFATLKGEP